MSRVSHRCFSDHQSGSWGFDGLPDDPALEQAAAHNEQLAMEAHRREQIADELARAAWEDSQQLADHTTEAADLDFLDAIGTRRLLALIDAADDVTAVAEQLEQIRRELAAYRRLFNPAEPTTFVGWSPEIGLLIRTGTENKPACFDTISKRWGAEFLKLVLASPLQWLAVPAVAGH